MTTFLTNAQSCPSCGHKLSAHAHNDEEPPQSGDFSLCIQCGTALIFGKNLELRLLSDLERRRLSPQAKRVLQQAEKHLRRLKEQS